MRPAARTWCRASPSQSSIEYGTHTTRTIVSLLESGMAARYPNIRWVFAHAGGTMPFLLARIVGRKLPVGPDGMVTLDPSDTSRQGGPERLALLRRFYYEVAQQTNVVALGALRRVVPISQIVFGTDYPASDSGGKASPLLDHAPALPACSAAKSCGRSSRRTLSGCFRSIEWL